jgi:holo-[acyl-carrier protein] synthase
MTSLRTGIDLVEIPRISLALARWGGRFLNKVFTPAEIAFCHDRAEALAVHFAAKEAVMKALGTGAVGVGWRDVEVVYDPRGAPSLCLHGRAAARARELGLKKLAVSMSHTRDHATAVVVALSQLPSE